MKHSGFEAQGFPLPPGMGGPMGNFPVTVDAGRVAGTGKVAVFDVCGTLYDSNTTFDFIDYYFRKKAPGGFRFFCRARKNYLLAVINFMVFKLTGMDLLRRIGLGFLGGEAVCEVRRAAGEFAMAFLPFRENRLVMELMESLRATHRIVLISGSCDIVVEAIAEELCVEEFYGSNLGTAGGLLTGKLATDLLEEKAELVLSRFAGVGELVVVTDNKTDLELVRLATKAWIVLNRGDGAFWHRQSLGNMEFIDLSK